MVKGRKWEISTFFYLNSDPFNVPYFIKTSDFLWYTLHSERCQWDVRYYTRMLTYAYIILANQYKVIL